MKCIYCIKNIANNKMYIGSAKDFHKRKLRHLNTLRRGTHHNIYLQRAFNKNSENFVFEILEEVYKANQLFKKEQEWIDKLKPEYNIGSVSGGDNYTNHPDKEKLRIKLTAILRKAKRPGPRFGKTNPNWRGGSTYMYCSICKIKIVRAKNKKTCKNCRDICGKKNPFYGKKHSKKYKKIASERQKGRFNISQCKKCSIDGIEYISISQAARSLGMLGATVYHRLKSKNIKFKNWILF